MPDSPARFSPSRARRLAEIVQRAIDEVDVVGVRLDAAALQQVEQVGARPLRQLHTAPGMTAMSADSVTFSSTAIGLPLSSRIIESCVSARLSSRTGSLITGRSGAPQNFFGSRMFG